MTNSVLGVDNSTSTSAYNKTQAAGSGELFSAILQAKMNSSLLSIADFDETAGTDETNIFGSGLYGSTTSTDGLPGSSSLYGDTGSSLLGSGLYGSDSSLYGTSLMSGLLGDSSGSLSSSSTGGINSETMLMVILMAMMLGGGDSEGSQLMLTSLASALSGDNNYRSAAYRNTQTGVFRGLSLTGSAAKSTYVFPGTGSYPSSMGKACSPSVVNNVGSRSAAAYNKVVEQFNVETNSRYTPYKNGSTYCNIYVWDVTTAMGAQIPHRVDSNGDIATSSTKDVTYMTANRMYDWLGGEKGREYGWKEVTAEEAQKYANMGCPAVAAWKNPKGHGHIQMVVPSRDGQYNEDKGVAISQAGSKVIEYGYISDVYKSSRLKDIKYFVHA